MDKGNSKKYKPVKSADRVFDVFEELLKHPDGLTTHELGQQLNIASSSIHSLVLTMLHRKYVQMDVDRKIKLGTKFYEFVDLFSNDPLLVLAKPIMKGLASKINENIHLAVLDGLNVVYIESEQTTQPIRYHVEAGHTQYAHITAVGKMLLSQYSPSTIKSMYKDFTFEKYTKNTITSVGALCKELEDISSRGFSIDNSESYANSKCYAAPIYNGGNQMIASISISIPFFRAENFNDQDMIHMILEAGESISSNIKKEG